MSTEPSAPRTKAATKVTIALAVVIALALGSAAGTGGYTFIYAKGASYLSDDPASCANCHIMQNHLDAYFKSTHRAVATCNDCHTPSGLIPKYFTKADHGFFHSLAFTTGQFHEPIQMKGRSRAVTEAACRKCHQDIVHDIDLTLLSAANEQMSCTRCHPSVGHPN
jgi:cytochrome c nitrite reductase small subunit